MSADKARVFVSYSRQDSDFADEIVMGLRWAGFEVMIDRQSIVEGEDWRRRLGALIANADTVVPILSRASVRSEVFAWEVEEAHRLTKRLLPVLLEPTGDAPVPERVAELNYVRFDPFEDGRPRSFMNGLQALTTALKTDLDWLREHTRLYSRAMEWDADGRPGSRLLRDDDVAAAREWLARRPKNAPAATALHLAFIEASELAEAQRASEERQRLEEIAQAQSERERAQGERARALDQREAAFKKIRRRTFLGIAGTSIFAGATGWTSYRTILAEQQSELDRQQREAAQEALEGSRDELDNWKRLTRDDAGQPRVEGGPVEVVRNPPHAAGSFPAAPSWAIEAVGADRSPEDGAGVVMALLGTGIEVENPAFAGMELIQRDFTGEGNGDDNGHGTHTASLAFGRAVDNQRIGVAPGVGKALVAKVISSSGAGSRDSIPAALDWVTKYEDGIVDVVFMGIGFDFPRDLALATTMADEDRLFYLASTLRRFLQAVRTIESISLAARARGKGMTFVTSGTHGSFGNPQRIPETSPTAVAKGFLSVAALDRGDDGYRIAAFADSEATLCAPGVNVPGAFLGARLQNLTGSSIAAGVAAGTAALWWSHLRRQSPGTETTAEAVWQHMRSSLRTTGFAPEVKPDERGLGLVQAPGI